MKRAFVDFDGTIVEVYDRYLKILNDFLRTQNIGLIEDRRRYIELKKIKRKDHLIVQEILGSVFDIELYVEFKRKRLEDPTYLALDRLIGDPSRSYSKMKEIGFEVIVVSKRNRVKELSREIDSFGVKFCDEVICVSPIQGKNAKYERLRGIARSGDLIIGDSAEDVQAGRLLGIDCYFVRSGLEEFSDELGVRSMVFEDYDSVADHLYRKG